MLKKVYDNIYKILATNEDILSYFNIDPSAYDEDEGEKLLNDIAKRIHKRSKPPVVIGQLPIIAFYTPGGRRDSKNYNVYNTVITFDIYTNDDVDQAQEIAELLDCIFNDTLVELGVESMKGETKSEYESNSGLDNVYTYTKIMSIPVYIE